MLKGLSILGSTGSIGIQTIDVARSLGARIHALSAHHNVKLLEKQAREFNPRVVAVFDEAAASQLKVSLGDTSIKVVSGLEGLCEAACVAEADMVVNAVVGMVGVYPTFEAIKAHKDIALANKETLVVAGELITKLAKENKVRLLPIDSEHSAIFQCLGGLDATELNKIILTASGGPFWGKKPSELRNVTPSQAIAHPNWNMGAKISVDSATMMNKGLEIIEASWLFGLTADKIDVVVHKESIVHSMVEYKDGAVLAQLGVPDMRLPIQYALTFPFRMRLNAEKLDLIKASCLTFCEPDYETFKCLDLCKEALLKGGSSPAIINGANEEAVRLFLENKISFLTISDMVQGAFENIKAKELGSIDDVTVADKCAREYVKGMI